MDVFVLVYLFIHMKTYKQSNKKIILIDREKLIVYQKTGFKREFSRFLMYEYK